jgi:hypothetical protein
VAKTEAAPVPEVKPAKRSRKAAPAAEADAATAVKKPRRKKAAA